MISLKNTLTQLLLISKSVRSKPGLGLCVQFLESGSYVFHLSILVARLFANVGGRGVTTTTTRGFQTDFEKMRAISFFSFRPKSRLSLHERNKTKTVFHSLYMNDHSTRILERLRMCGVQYKLTYKNYSIQKRQRKYIENYRVRLFTR